mmetsp:Transcript_46176/g.81253  ORF Transcript_46176/g.81253 Transcript_46176/m.81253 type:complete len:99 (+) Transcript_46176:75-371(+)
MSSPMVTGMMCKSDGLHSYNRLFNWPSDTRTEENATTSGIQSKDVLPSSVISKCRKLSMNSPMWRQHLCALGFEDVVEGERSPTLISRQSDSNILRGN